MGNFVSVWKVTGRERSLEAVDFRYPPASLDEATRGLPGGAYTTFRTFGARRVLCMDSHYERLEETAWLAGITIHLDHELIRTTLGQALEKAGNHESRVRLIVDLEQTPGDIYILVEPLHVPAPGAYLHGVRVVTRPMQRENPKAKLTNFIHTASTVRHQLPEGINEALMVGEDGRVLEGLSSNFFAVQDGVIWTADEGVLSGITRATVLEVIRSQGLPLRLEGIPVGELERLEEAFLTSASRAVLPVTEIDGHPVGNGRPGPITRRLLEDYLQQIEAQIEQI